MQAYFLHVVYLMKENKNEYTGEYFQSLQMTARAWKKKKKKQEEGKNSIPTYLS